MFKFKIVGDKKALFLNLVDREICFSLLQLNDVLDLMKYGVQWASTNQ